MKTAVFLQKSDGAPGNPDQPLLLHFPQLTDHGAAVDRKKIGEVDHGKGQLEGRIFSFGRQLHEIAHKLFPDAALA